MELFVVIPCYNEPDVIGAINSIAQCDIPPTPVTIIVVVNASEDSSADVIKRNKASVFNIKEWEKTKPPWLQIVCEHVENVPKKIAGVGHARKLGMDLAYELSVNKKESILICYDADCTCSPNYLTSIEQAFRNNPKHDVATIYFEHKEAEKGAITDYELFLRYHYQGLRFTGYPYAYQTIGSSMAVRGTAYKAFGGMNLRKAGEDFYFLHKLIPYRNVLEINTCTVYPSARTSDRVPFGTGHAVEKHNNSTCKTYYTYHPKVYRLIAQLVRSIHNSNVESGISLSLIPIDIQAFLNDEGFSITEVKIRKQSKSDALYHQNIFRWMNGFRMLKLVHYLRDKAYTNIPINDAVRSFWYIRNGEKLTLDTLSGCQNLDN